MNQSGCRWAAFRSLSRSPAKSSANPQLRHTTAVSVDNGCDHRLRPSGCNDVVLARQAEVGHLGSAGQNRIRSRAAGQFRSLARSLAASSGGKPCSVSQACTPP